MNPTLRSSHDSLCKLSIHIYLFIYLLVLLYDILSIIDRNLQ